MQWRRLVPKFDCLAADTCRSASVSTLGPSRVGSYTWGPQKMYVFEAFCLFLSATPHMFSSRTVSQIDEIGIFSANSRKIFTILSHNQEGVTTCQQSISQKQTTSNNSTFDWNQFEVTKTKQMFGNYDIIQECPQLMWWTCSDCLLRVCRGHPEVSLLPNERKILHFNFVLFPHKIILSSSSDFFHKCRSR